MAMANLGNEEGQGIYDINITPFVDIVLVLLIIFMISTPMLLYKGLKLDLPSTVNSEDISHVTLNLYVTREGHYYLDKNKIELSDFKKTFSQLLKSKTKLDAVISADKEVKHGRVIDLADALKSLGINQIGFNTQKK